MEYKDFSKNDLMKILDLIQVAVNCKTEADIVRATAMLKDLVSAEKGICCLGDASSGRLEKYINLNYPPEWLAMYAENEFYRHDPIVRYNYSFFNTQLWTDAVNIFNDRPCVDLMNNASEFGLKYGIASGVNGEGFRGSLVSFSSSKNHFTKHHLKILDVVTPHIHQALVRICELASKNGRRQSLSEREKEVLNWMKAGKTNWEISVILNISERTVKFHVQNIERKLDAVNKAH
ncbi:MAG: LuxR C-terminal-related transcriptional regulator, partial [Deltaproteobacteria bacterium]|nr:LuxR C-terminal-related transcriptional regulator [Deltaproteobacteria bacterium]